MLQAQALRNVKLEKYKEIISMVQDSSGYLWMGTVGGVIQYNGYEDKFIELNPEAEIMCLHAYKGKVYAGTDKGEVYCIENNRHTQKVFNKSKTKITSILCIEAGVLASSYGDGLFLINPNDYKQKQESSGLISNYIYSMVFGNPGYVMLATDAGLQSLKINFQEQEEIRKISVDGSLATKLVKSPSGYFVGTYDKGLIQYNELENRSTSIPLPHGIKGINALNYCDHKLYVATKIGLWAYDVIGGAWSKISGQSITLAFTDEENNLWFVENNNELKIKNLFFEKEEIPGASKVQAFLKLTNQTIFGTDQGLRFIENNGKSRIGLPGVNVTVIKKIYDHYWIGTFNDGVYVLDELGKMKVHLQKRDGLGDNSIIAMQNTTEGIYLSTLGGMCIVDNQTVMNGNYVVHKAKEDLGYNYILSIYQSKNGDLFFGTDHNGFFKKDKIGLEHYTTIIEKNAKLSSVYSFCEDKDDQIWLTSSSQGICIFHDDKIRIASGEQDFKSEYTSIARTSTDHIIAVNEKSIDLIGPATRSIRHFDKEINIETELSIINAIEVVDNKVYMLHDNALYTYTEPKLDFKLAPNVVLNEIEVNFKLVSQEQKTFEQSDNNFKFYYTGIWLTSPEKVHYAYMIDGVDKAWNFTKERSARYPNLPPGKYTFRVKAGEQPSIGKAKETIYVFQVLKAWYNTLFFQILFFALPISLGFWYYRNKRNQESLKTELSKLMIESQFINLKSQLNPHFLFNSFNTLIGLIELDPTRGVRFTEKLTDFYRMILDLGKSDLIDTNKELELAKVYADILRERYLENIHIQLPESLSTGTMIPPLTLQMLLENAIKHNTISKSKHLYVSLKEEGGYLVMRNNISPKLSPEIASGIGLKNIVDRYKMFTDTAVEINDEHKEFVVRLPLISVHNNPYDSHHPSL